MTETADDCSGGHDHEGGRGGFVNALAEDVDEYRDSQYGPAAAEHPEAQPDAEPKWNRRESHRCSLASGSPAGRPDSKRSSRRER
jgi:hypothetical protein